MSANRLEEPLLRAFADEIMRMTGRRTTAYAGCVLESSAFRILWLLEESGPRTLRELSAELQLEQSTVNRQVNSAMRLGYVERFAEPGRSSRLVRATVEGHRLYAEDAQRRAALYAHAIHELGPDRTKAMVDSLRAFNDALDRAHEEAAGPVDA